jgi:hypothetical protein
MASYDGREWREPPRQCENAKVSRFPPSRQPCGPLQPWHEASAWTRPRRAGWALSAASPFLDAGPTQQRGPTRPAHPPSPSSTPPAADREGAAASLPSIKYRAFAVSEAHQTSRPSSPPLTNSCRSACALHASSHAWLFVLLCCCVAVLLCAWLQDTLARGVSVAAVEQREPVALQVRLYDFRPCRVASTTPIRPNSSTPPATPEQHMSLACGLTSTFRPHLLSTAASQVLEGSLPPQLVGTRFTVQPVAPPSQPSAAAAAAADAAASDVAAAPPRASAELPGFSWQAMAAAADGQPLVASVVFPGDGTALFRSAFVDATQ